MKRMIADIHPDVICFQEFLFPVGKYVPKDYKRVGLSVSHPIYVKKGIKPNRHKFHVFWESCIVNGLNIINVHTRWEERIIKRTIGQINGQLSRPTVACGDWNNNLSAIQSLNLKMESVRQILGIPEERTFQNFKHPEICGSIDHFFVKGIKPLQYKTITTGYGAKRISDHYPIFIDI